MWGRRILGVDAGVSAVKVAQVAVSPGGKRRLVRLALCENLDELAGLLSSRSWWRDGDRIHMGFPSDKTVVRKLKLPFRAQEKVQGTLPFELEGEVPFPVEEIVAGYLILDKGRDGTELIALAAPKDEVGGWLERLRTLGIDPPVLEPDVAALARLVAQGPFHGEEAVGFLDIGASKTNLIVLHRGRPQAIRTIRRGLGASEAVLPLPEAIVQEIKRTLTAVRARGDAPWPKALYLCGGVVDIDGGTSWLEEKLGTTVGVFSPLDAFACTLDQPPMAHPARFAAAIALAGLGARQDSAPCNLRIGEFAFRPGLSAFRGRAIAAGLLSFVGVAMGLADLQAHVAIRQRALDGLQEETRALFRQAFPEGTPMVQPVVQMQRFLEERKARHLSLLGKDARGTTLELLREISIREQAHTLRLTELDLSGEIVSLRGEANSYDTIEKAKDHWQSSPLLDGVEIKNAKKNPKTQLWDFQCAARRKTS